MRHRRVAARSAFRDKTLRYSRAGAKSPPPGKPASAWRRRTAESCSPPMRGGRGWPRPAPAGPRSHAVMSAVAEWLPAGLLAAAQPHFFAYLGGEWYRGEPGALVRAVAER